MSTSSFFDKLKQKLDSRVLSSEVGIENIRVVISPYDPRTKKLKYNEKTQAEWVKGLYDNIVKDFDKYQKR